MANEGRRTRKDLANANKTMKYNVNKTVERFILHCIAFCNVIKENDDFKICASFHHRFSLCIHCSDVKVIQLDKTDNKVFNNIIFLQFEVIFVDSVSPHDSSLHQNLASTRMYNFNTLL